MIDLTICDTHQKAHMKGCPICVEEWKQKAVDEAIAHSGARLAEVERELAEVRESLRICNGVRMIHATGESRLQQQLDQLRAAVKNTDGWLKIRAHPHGCSSSNALLRIEDYHCNCGLEAIQKQLAEALKLTSGSGGLATPSQSQG